MRCFILRLSRNLQLITRFGNEFVRTVSLSFHFEWCIFILARCWNLFRSDLPLRFENLDSNDSNDFQFHFSLEIHWFRLLNTMFCEANCGCFLELVAQTQNLTCLQIDHFIQKLKRKTLPKELYDKVRFPTPCLKSHLPRSPGSHLHTAKESDPR